MTSTINRALPRSTALTVANQEARRNFDAAADQLDIVAGGNYPAIILRLASNVANGETVTIHDKTYEFRTSGSPTGANVAVDASGGVTPTLMSAALVTAFNASKPGGIGKHLHAVALSVNEIAFIYCLNGVSPNTAPTITASETLAGSNNTIDSALGRGSARGAQKAVIARVPTTQEVALGKMNIFLPFTPVTAQVEVQTTSSNAAVVWDGAITITAASGSAPAYVTLDNSGLTDWATTSTVRLFAYGAGV